MIVCLRIKRAATRFFINCNALKIATSTTNYLQGYLIRANVWGKLDPVNDLQGFIVALRTLKSHQTVPFGDVIIAAM
jgi:hypothetical protein